jgi:hypothetical protein
MFSSAPTACSDTTRMQLIPSRIFFFRHLDQRADSVVDPKMGNYHCAGFLYRGARGFRCRIILCRSAAGPPPATLETAHQVCFRL